MSIQSSVRVKYNFLLSVKLLNNSICLSVSPSNNLSVCEKCGLFGFFPLTKIDVHPAYICLESIENMKDLLTIVSINCLSINFNVF